MRTFFALAVVGAVAPMAAHADSFALIVSNNRSLDLGRPDLRYADDDGVKYYELFASLASEEHVVLLTEPDADTRRLFPDATAAAARPTRDNVLAAATRLAAEIRATREAGRDAEFYFVFAGHGDVDRGQGFLELADGPFRASDVEALLAQIPYDRAHIILDSCNSFFVINPRKPGGRRFATPRDAAASAAKRLPNVGVFLSTSAEAEAFEWSALQSGIFSHAVRSGLSGAADANGDGRITYRELEAFVHVAAQTVRNPLYRPKVYARGPDGAAQTAIVDLSTRRSKTLEIDDMRAMRITIRDADQLPWVDTHKEEGVALTLVLPERIAATATVDEHTARDPQAPVARGPDDLFRGLFASPFGPRALAAYEASIRDAPPPVYGIAREDAVRMELLLSHTAGVDRQAKLLVGGAVLGGGLITALAGLYVRGHPADIRPLTSARDAQVIGWGLVGVGAAAAVYGGILMLRESMGERIYAQFRQDLESAREPVQVVARTELLLNDIRERERVWRRRLERLGWTGAALSVAGIVGTECFAPEGNKTLGRVGFSVGFAASVVGALAIRSNITPVERMVEIWRGDPGIQRLPRIAIQPTSGGALVGLEGSF